MFIGLQRTYAVIDKQKEIAIKPFLYTRIKARMDKTDAVSVSYKKILQPIIVTCIVIVAIIGGMKIGKIYPTTADQSILSTESYYWNDLKQEPIEVALLND